MGLEFLENMPEANEIGESAENVESLGEGMFLEHIKGFIEALKEMFEGSEGGENIIGNPEEDMETWHMQDSDVSCAVCCQEFVAEQLTGEEFTEQEFCEMAEEQGWFDPESGTAFEDVGNILEYMGFDVARQEGTTIVELAEMLDNGEKVIVGVNNMVLEDPEMANLPGMNANHAVQVIGLDTSDPDNVQVILNDPGVPNGQGVKHDLKDFITAWSTSNNYTVSATKE